MLWLDILIGFVFALFVWQIIVLKIGETNILMQHCWMHYFQCNLGILIAYFTRSVMQLAIVLVTDNFGWWCQRSRTLLNFELWLTLDYIIKVCQLNFTVSLGVNYLSYLSIRNSSMLTLDSALIVHSIFISDWCRVTRDLFRQWWWKTPSFLTSGENDWWALNRK